jgi:RimJ/RimL family protein N-acetyltransferase
VEDDQHQFIGYAGPMLAPDGHPLGPHAEIGWRLIRSAWGRGYATEAAKAALQDAFRRLGSTELLAYTSPENLRSQAVMSRLGLERDETRDFILTERGSTWHGLVWTARHGAREA